MKRRRIRAWAHQYAAVAATDRLARANRRLQDDPRCAVSRYVAGCACFDRDSAATGVRHFMIAHHAEHRFHSAALLAFAGLNWIARPHDPLLDVLLATCDEYPRLIWDHDPLERLLLDAFTQDAPARTAQAPRLKQLARLPISNLRKQIAAQRTTAHAPPSGSLTAPA